MNSEQVATFRSAFAKVAPLLRRAKGYKGHFLAQGIETPHIFNLIVRWQSLEDHTPGFEASEDHQVFMEGLQDHFAEEPTVYHIQAPKFTAGEDDDLSSDMTALMALG